MSDDSFIREVNEELRQEKARALWGRYGPLLIGAAILLVLATGVFQIYSYWQTNKAGGIGDKYLAGLAQAEMLDYDAAFKSFDDVKNSDFGAYPQLADLRKASLLAEKGETAEAISLYDAIAAQEKTPELLKKVAQIRAAYILVDTGTFEDVEKRAKQYANDVDTMRLSAREALGLAAYKAGKIEDAVYYFQKIADEGLAGMKTTERARMMLEIIHGSGQAAKG